MQLKSLDKLISALEKTNPKSSEDRLRTAQELDALRTKRKFIMENPAVLGMLPLMPHIRYRPSRVPFLCVFLPVLPLLLRLLSCQRPPSCFALTASIAIGSSSATKPVPHQSPSASLPRQALRVGSSIQNGGGKRKGVRECLRNTPRLEHALFAHLSRALVRLQHLRNDAPHAGDSDSE